MSTKKIAVVLLDDDIPRLQAEADRQGISLNRVITDYALAFCTIAEAEEQGEEMGQPLFDLLRGMERRIASSVDALDERVRQLSQTVSLFADMQYEVNKPILGSFPAGGEAVGAARLDRIVRSLGHNTVSNLAKGGA
jgi:hypothetical protein